ncbi:energy transducer TonB [Akkermansiaceae bacterium]|nr:energy transducer TonB [Akkermansiaceae bacterium]
MKLKSIIFGVATTAVLFCVLVATRMMDVTPAAETLKIREVQTVKLSEADEVELIDADPDVELKPPVELSSTTLSTLRVSDVSLPDLNVSAVPALALENFSVDRDPAPLPVVVKKVVKKTKEVSPKVVTKKATKVVTKTVPKTVSKVSTKTLIKPKPKPQGKPAPIVAKKSSYSAGEIDQKLVLKYSPKVTFPRSVKDTDEGRVVVDITILPSGKTKLVAVVSSTHPDFIPLAKRLADGSRFSKPSHKGQPVTVTKRWPIVIRK